MRLVSGDIAALIPAYQAERSIGEVVRRTRQFVPSVVVVDDGSSDGTALEAAGAGAQVLRHGVNRGKGRALRTGFTELFPRGYFGIVTLDADGQHLPEEIPKLIDALAKSDADLVLGTRAHLFGEMSPVRRTSNRISSWMIARTAGVPLPDAQTGFRIYTERLFLNAGLPESRFEAESAVLVRAARLGFKIVSVPVRLGFADGRTTSHYRPLTDSLRIAGAVTRARLAPLK